MSECERFVSEAAYLVIPLARQFYFRPFCCSEVRKSDLAAVQRVFEAEGARSLGLGLLEGFLEFPSLSLQDAFFSPACLPKPSTRSPQNLHPKPETLFFPGKVEDFRDTLKRFGVSHAPRKGSVDSCSVA